MKPVPLVFVFSVGLIIHIMVGRNPDAENHASSSPWVISTGKPAR
jgi:hypothetical protein